MNTSNAVTTIERGANQQKWSILGEAYVPLHVTDTSLLMHARFSPGSFVPTHIHETQDEFIYILEGTMTVELDGKTLVAGPGSEVTLPMKVPHALFNRSDKPALALVFVSPTGKMYDYMKKIDGLADPAEVVRLGAEHEVRFV